MRQKPQEESDLRGRVTCVQPRERFDAVQAWVRGGLALTSNFCEQLRLPVCKSYGADLSRWKGR